MALYKDFNKDVKDLLTKNYTDAGKWKVESKFKGPKDHVYVNPQASNNGVNVDVEFNPSCCGAKLKVNVTPDLAMKATVTYEEKGHKVEVVSDKNLEYEVSYEGKLDKLRISEKLNKKAVESGLAYAVAPHCDIGAGVTYGLKDGALSWTLGTRYVSAGRILSIGTAQLKSFTLGALFPLKVGDRKISLAVQTECGKGKFAGTAGIDTACLFCPKSTVRVRVNNELKWAVAYVSKMADNWKAAFTVDASLKPGVTLTRE